MKKLKQIHNTYRYKHLAKKYKNAVIHLHTNSHIREAGMTWGYGLPWYKLEHGFTRRSNGQRKTIGIHSKVSKGSTFLEKALGSNDRLN